MTGSVGYRTFEHLNNIIHRHVYNGRKIKTFKIRKNQGDYENQYLKERHRLDRHLIENVTM